MPTRTDAAAVDVDSLLPSFIKGDLDSLRADVAAYYMQRVRQPDPPTPGRPFGDANAVCYLVRGRACRARVRAVVCRTYLSSETQTRTRQT